MTASALPIAASVHNATGQGVAHAATIGAKSTAAGPLGSFEALVAALFPQPGATAEPAPPGGGGAPTETLSAETDDDGGSPDPSPESLVPDAAPAADAATTALLAAELAVRADTNATAAKGETSAKSEPPAWGLDKAQGSPAQPALLHADPKADLAEKFGSPPAEDTAPAPSGAQAADAATQAQGLAPELASEAATPPVAASDVTPPAWGRDKTKGVPAAPALEHANAKADLAQKFTPPAAETPPVDPPVDQPDGETASPAAVAAVAVKAEPRPTSLSTAKSSSKDQHGRTVAEVAQTADPKHTPQATGQTEHARAVVAAAKTAAPQVDTPEPEARQAPASLDAPELTAPAESQAAAATASPTPAHSNHPVRGAPETVANLAAQIVKKLEGRSTRFDLELDPAGLGKVDVRVEIGAAGRLTAALTFDNPQAAADLKSRASELQRALEQAGFELAGGLSFDVADHRQQGHAWQDQDDTGRAFRGQAFRAALETAGDADMTAAQDALRLRRGVSAGLDLRI